MNLGLFLEDPGSSFSMWLHWRRTLVQYNIKQHYNSPYIINRKGAKGRNAKSAKEYLCALCDKLCG